MIEEYKKVIRFLLEHDEHYQMCDGPEITQFGKCQLKLIPKPSDMTKNSKEHLERRINAIISEYERLNNGDKC